jgi:hypothetical protein
MKILRALRDWWQRRVNAIHRRTIGNAVVRCYRCNRPIQWQESWVRDRLSENFWCERCAPAWARLEPPPEVTGEPV